MSDPQLINTNASVNSFSGYAYVNLTVPFLGFEKKQACGYFEWPRMAPVSIEGQQAGAEAQLSKY